MIDTSLNIHVDNMNKIIEIASRLNTTKKHVIVLLMMKIMEKNLDHIQFFTPVKYQPDDIKANWHCFHIRFREDENEFFTDLRKFCKYSVSYLLAISIEKYSNVLLNERTAYMYNYPRFTCYVMIQEEIEDVISWKSYWGYPEKELTRIVTETRRSGLMM